MRIPFFFYQLRAGYAHVFPFNLFSHYFGWCHINCFICHKLNIISLRENGPGLVYWDYFGPWERIWGDIDYKIRDGMVALFGENK